MIATIAVIAAIAELFFSQRSQRSYGLNHFPGIVVAAMAENGFLMISAIAAIAAITGIVAII